MGGMQLDRVDAQARRSAGGINEAITQCGQACCVEGPRRRFGRQMRHIRRADRLPPAIGLADQLPAFPGPAARAFSSGVAKLDGNRHRGHRPDRGEHTRERRLGGVIPKTKAAGGDAADRLDRGRLDHQQSGSRHGQLAEVCQMPVGRAPVIGRVLAHRCNHDPVGELERAQLEGCKEHRAGLGRFRYRGLSTSRSIRHLNS